MGKAQQIQKQWNEDINELKLGVSSDKSQPSKAVCSYLWLHP